MSKSLIYTAYLISSLLGVSFSHLIQSQSNIPNKLPIFELKPKPNGTYSHVPQVDESPQVVPLELSRVTANSRFLLIKSNSSVKRKKNFSDLAQSLILVDATERKLQTITTTPSSEPPTKGILLNYQYQQTFCQN